MSFKPFDFASSAESQQDFSTGDGQQEPQEQKGFKPFSFATDSARQETKNLPSMLDLKNDLTAKLEFVRDRNKAADAYDIGEGVTVGDALKSVQSTAFNTTDPQSMKHFIGAIEDAYKKTSDDRYALGSVAGDALKRGYVQAGAGLARAGIALKPGAATKQDEDMLESLDQAEASYATRFAPRAVGSMKDVASANGGLNKASALLKFAVESIAENLPRQAPGIGLAIAGGIVGGVPGAMAGAGIGSFGGNLGEAVGDQTGEGLELDKTLAIAQGVGYSLIDSLFSVERMAGGIISGVFKKGLAEGARKKFIGTAGKALLVAAKVGGEEAVNEPLQSQVVGRARRYLQTGTALAKKADGSMETTEDVVWATVDESMGGFMSGLGLGGAASGSKYLRDSSTARRAQANGFVQAISEDAQGLDQFDHVAILQAANAEATLSHLGTDGVTDGLDDKTVSGIKEAANKALENAVSGMSDNAKIAWQAAKDKVTSDFQWSAVDKNQISRFNLDNVTKSMADSGEGYKLGFDSDSGIGLAVGDDKRIVVMNMNGLRMPEGVNNVFDNVTDATVFARELDLFNTQRMEALQPKFAMLTKLMKAASPGADAVIVDTPAQLPSHVKRAYAKTVAEGNPGLAMYDPGNGAGTDKIYIVHDNIKSVGDAIVNIFHESIHSELFDMSRNGELNAFRYGDVKTEESFVSAFEASINDPTKAEAIKGVVSKAVNRVLSKAGLSVRVNQEDVARSFFNTVRGRMKQGDGGTVEAPSATSRANPVAASDKTIDSFVSAHREKLSEEQRLSMIEEQDAMNDISDPQSAGDEGASYTGDQKHVAAPTTEAVALKLERRKNLTAADIDVLEQNGVHGRDLFDYGYRKWKGTNAWRFVGKPAVNATVQHGEDKTNLQPAIPAQDRKETRNQASKAQEAAPAVETPASVAPANEEEISLPPLPPDMEEVANFGKKTTDTSLNSVANINGSDVTLSSSGKYYHGGLPSGATIDSIDTNRTGTKQGKKGTRTYGGFYLTDETSKSWSESYAKKNGTGVHELTFKDGTRAFKTEEDIDRVSAEQRKQLLDAGYSALIGKDVMGRNQVVLLNKDSVQSFKSSQRQMETRNTELFPEKTDFSGKLDFEAEISEYSEQNGIGTAQYKNPNNGSTDVYLSAFSDHDFIAYIRLYDKKGNPTDRFASKLERRTERKGVTRQMIERLQKILPEGHEYTEDVSVSTDGLRFIATQLEKGYELALDSNGKMLTNRVAINGESIVNDLGDGVIRREAEFDNIRVTDKKTFERVKSVIAPILKSFNAGLGESNVYWENGSAYIDIPVLRKMETIHAAKLSPSQQEKAGIVTKTLKKTEENYLLPEEYPVTETPVEEIKLSEDVPNFKEGADDKTGETEPIRAESYKRLGTPAIVVWERRNGNKEVITGRHRLALARRTGEKTIPTQIVKEADGFTKEMALTLDAESNIRDGQGSVKDYANYIRERKITKQQASGSGILGRDKGRQGYAIGAYAEADLYSAFRDDKVGPAKAAAIAELAPNNAPAQQLGMKYATGHTAQEVSQYMRTVISMRNERESSGQQLDLLGFDTSWQEEAEKQATAASRIIRSMQEELAALKNARSLSKEQRQKVVSKYGVRVGDTASIEKRIAELGLELDRWENWHLNPDLVDVVKREAGTKKDFALESTTKAQIDAEAKKREDKAEIDRRQNATISDNSTAAELDAPQLDLGGDAAPTDLFGAANVVKQEQKPAPTTPDVSKMSYDELVQATYKGTEARRKLSDLPPRLQDDVAAAQRDGVERTEKAIIKWLADKRGTLTYQGDPNIKEILKNIPLQDANVLDMEAGKELNRRENPDKTPEQKPSPASKPIRTDVKSPIDNVSDEKKARAAELIERMTKRANRMSAGLDPESLIDGIELASIYIEGGVKTFAQFAQSMKEASEELYGKIKDHLITIWTGASVNNPDIEQLLPRDAASVIAAIDEPAKKDYSNNQEEKDNVPGPANDMESDSPLTVPPYEVGKGDVQLGSERSNEGSGGRRTTTEIQRDIAESNLGIHDSPPAPGRTQGDSGIRKNQPRHGSSVAGNPKQSGGGIVDVTRPDAFDEREEAVDEPSTTELEPDPEDVAREHEGLLGRLTLQRKANTRPVKLGDAQNIVDTVPILFDGQQEDVLKAETRFLQENGYGMMFTNGTGTGKTYTGLGIINRYFRSGKKNIIVVAPNTRVIDAWVTAGRDLGLSISKLDDTNSSGSGIVITTYANFGANNQLAKRQWDLIVADESHNLSSNKDGTLTGYATTLRAISYHPDSVYDRVRMLHQDLISALNDAMDKHDNERANNIRSRLTQIENNMREEYKTKQGKNRTRVLFLSATPFAYVKNVEYAEGYLFEFDRDEGKVHGYNQADGRERFYIEHFGYGMRTNKLTGPSAGVDEDVMQRQFNEWLREQGVLSRRMLDVDADYQRKFVVAEDLIGKKIDEGIDYLRESNNGRYRKIAEYVSKKFDYTSRMFLLEALKAKHAIPLVREMLSNGKKVVVFHDYNVGGGFNPFDLSGLDRTEQVQVERGQEPVPMSQLIDEISDARPDLFNMDFSSLQPPIIAFQRAFPNARFINGSAAMKITDKQKVENVKWFNDDANGPTLIVVQADSGREGISLHDTTGKYERKLVNLGLPIKPTAAIQQEGRIYRTGQHPKSNATFIYMNTGTTFERFTFAEKVFERSATAENLAMGEDARQLRESYIEAFQDAQPYEQDENEGRGGKARDKNTAKSISLFDKAKTFYFANQKRNSRNKSYEGTDYFATPEPIGLKMVEWLHLKKDERVLEPSAGHGAIARWLPETANKTIIEPSSELLSRASLTTSGRIIQGRFEDHPEGNWYAGIVMNPPFGTAGRTAIDHVSKAFTHLKDGGRIVAIIPEGPSADAKFNKWYEEASGARLIKSISLPSSTFERAGTRVRTRIVIIDKVNNGNISTPDMSKVEIDSDNINDIFDRIEQISVPQRTNVESVQDARQREIAQGLVSRRDFVIPSTSTPEVTYDNGGKAPIVKTYHDKRQQEIFIVKPSIYMDRAMFDLMHNKAKTKDGWYSRKWGNTPAGFAFTSMDVAEEFAKENADVFKPEAQAEPETRFRRGGTNSSTGNASDGISGSESDVSIVPDDNSIASRYVRALPSTDPEARRRLSVIEQAYDVAYSERKLSDIEDEARVEYAKDVTAAELSLLSGQGLSGDTEQDATRMARDKIAVDGMMRKAIDTKATSADVQTAILAGWQWFKRGSEAAVALRLRFDPVNTPEGRRSMLMRMVFSPSAKDVAAIESMGNVRQRAEALAPRAKMAVALLKHLERNGVNIQNISASDLMDNEKLSAIIRLIETHSSTKGDKIHEYWRNAILSGPTTQIVNIIGNVTNASIEAFVQRPVEAIFNSLAGNKDAATFRSIKAMYKAIIPSIKAANKNFAKAFETENGIVGPAVSPFDERNVAIGGKTGRVVRVPQRGMLATDEWFKTIFMAMNVADFATRQFDGLVNSGVVKESDRDAFMSASMDQRSVAFKQAWKETLSWSFQQEPGTLAKGILHWRNDPMLGFWLKFIFPFVKTPANIISTGIRKSPIGTLNYIRNVAAGKYSSGEALKFGAEQAVMFAVLSSLYFLLKGDDDDDMNRPRITGSRKSTAFSSKGEREAEYRNFPPMSIRIGDKWYSYSRVEPLATMVSTSVDLISAAEDAYDGRVNDAASTLFGSLINNIRDKTFLTGVSNLLGLVEGDKTKSEALIEGTIAGFMPNIARTAMRSTDEYVRDMRNRGTGEAWFVRSAEKVLQMAVPLPGIASPKRVDSFGDPVKREGGFLFNFLIPFRMQDAEKINKIDSMLKRYNDSVDRDARWYPTAPDIHTYKFGREEVRMNDAEYERYQMLAGEIATRHLDGLKFKYENPDEREINRVKDVFKNAREIARNKMKPDVFKRWKSGE